MSSAAGADTGGRTALFVGTVAVALLMGLVIAQWSAHPRAEFTPGSFADVDAAVTAAGLQVCTTVDEPDPRANQAVASRTYTVAASCTGPAELAVVDRFADVAHRDATARELTSRARPRGSGVVYTLRDMTVFVPGPTEDDVQDRLDASLRAGGAR